jgi:hypothetical protein
MNSLTLNTIGNKAFEVSMHSIVTYSMHGLWEEKIDDILQAIRTAITRKFHMIANY